MGNLSQQKNFVEDVLAFQERLDGILQYCFQNQELFKQALKSSFEHFLNINQKGAAEQVARYVDQKMRGQKGLTELEVESKLDQVMVLFKYLHEKDIFEAFYKKHLSKRLLLGKSASYELEKSMLAKLKAVSPRFP
jgi:cullin-4